MPKARVQIDIPTASGRRQGWCKLVTGIDRSKRGGWAILGDFLNEGETDLKVGAVIATMAPVGSAKNGGKEVIVEIVQPDGLETVRGEGCASDGYFDLWKKLPTLLDCIEVAMTLRPEGTSGDPFAPFTDEELAAELQRRGHTGSL